MKMSITIRNNYNDIPIVYTGDSDKKQVFEFDSEGTMRFDRELAKAQFSGQPTFGTAMTREELFQSIDEQMEKNKKLYGKTEADLIKETCPNWRTARFKFVGEDKTYSYFEWIREREKRHSEHKK